jgi:hypothetical protein
MVRPLRSPRFAFAAPLLAWLLLLVSTAGLAEHEHTAVIETAGYECAVDHHAGEPSPTGSGAGLGCSGERHRHECLGCHQTGQRSLAGASPAVATILGFGDDRDALPADAPRESRPRRGGTLRGPPLS